MFTNDCECQLTDLIAELRHKKIDTWITRINQEFQDLCKTEDDDIFQKLGQMTSRLYNAFAITASRVDVSDLDHFSVITITSKSKDIIPILPDPKRSPYSSSESKDQGAQFNEFVNQTLASWVNIPESIEKHLNRQAAK
jgi:hypothetical protein